METHYHMSAVDALWVVALVVAALGTIHLLALTYPTSPVSEGIISLGL